MACLAEVKNECLQWNFTDCGISIRMTENRVEPQKSHKVNFILFKLFGSGKRPKSVPVAQSMALLMISYCHNNIVVGSTYWFLENLSDSALNEIRLIKKVFNSHKITYLFFFRFATFIQRFRGAPSPFGFQESASTKFWLIFPCYSEVFGFLPAW